MDLSRLIWLADAANHGLRIHWRWLCDLNDRRIMGERFRTGVGYKPKPGENPPPTGLPPSPRP